MNKFGYNVRRVAKRFGICSWMCLIGLFCAAGWAQDTVSGKSQASATAGVAVPRLVRFSGMAKGAEGKPLKGVVGITFALYRDQEGGAALWLETQNVELDSNGRYTVMLGASKSDGLPSDLFASGEAHWLGVQPQAQQEQPRTLLVSVPYALKAADAETLGGKPSSAFLQAAPTTKPGSRTGATQKTGSSAAIGGSGTTNFIPMFTPNGSTLGNSAMFQTGGPGLGGKVGVGTMTPARKLDVNGGAIVRGSVSVPLSTSKVAIGTTSSSAQLETVVASEGTLAFRLRSGPNSFLDITPTNTGGRFQTVLNTVNNRDVIILPGATGRVGIATAIPSAQLETVVASEGTLAFRLRSGPNSFLDITPTNTGGRFQTVLNTVNNRDVIILPGTTGRVGIGTMSPANTLEVVAGGTTLADAWTTRSSRRFKTNIQPLEGALEKIGRLQGVSYERKTDGKHEIGVIAEEVDQIVPEVVSRDQETQEVQGVDYSRLAVLLIEAVKSQQAEIRQLKTQIEQLTSNPTRQ